MVTIEVKGFIIEEALEASSAYVYSKGGRSIAFSSERLAEALVSHEPLPCAVLCEGNTTTPLIAVNNGDEIYLKGSTHYCDYRVEVLL